MDSVALYVREFRKSSRRVKKRLDAYMLEPENQENVHDIRTSLRRLDASFLVMPKKLRRRNRKLIDFHKQFFRANSRVRDYDIIRDRIVNRMRGAFLDRTLADLDKKRMREAQRALDVARLVSMLPEAGLDGLEESELESRMNKVAGRLLRKIKAELPLVVADSRSIEELHQLRKDLKKLRYVLEVMSYDTKEQYGKKISKILKGKKAEDRLEELQDTLGTIHDIDITMQYLSALQKNVAASVIDEENVERDRLFRRFAKDFSP